MARFKQLHRALRDIVQGVLQLLRGCKFICNIGQCLDDLGSAALFLEATCVLDGSRCLVGKYLYEGRVICCVETHSITIQVQIADDLVLRDHGNAHPAPDILSSWDSLEAPLLTNVGQHNWLSEIVSPLGRIDEGY